MKELTLGKKMLGLALAVLASAAAQPVSAQTSTVFDPIGDVTFRFTPAFQDIVLSQVTKTASGDFELLMEVAGPVGVNPPLPPPARSGIWWVWAFDFDATTFPRGYPLAPGVAFWAECIVNVTWDGTEFAGTAIDRRPLLTGGEAIITPVAFTITDRILEAVVPSAVIGAVPASFVWGSGAAVRSGPVESQGYGFVDETAGTVFNPPHRETVQSSTVFDAAGDALYHAPAFRDFVFGQITKTASGDFELLMEMAGPVPLSPTIPPPASAEIWWLWGFDLDPTSSPRGYPSAPSAAADPEFMVYVSWDGAEFAGTAIDRRPLLTGGEAIVTPVPFSINGTIVEAFPPYAQIGDVPPSFPWRLRTIDYSGPVGSAGWRPVDLAATVFNP